MRLSVEDLRSHARLRFRLLPDTAAVMEEFARNIADEVRACGGGPLNLILPVGPVAQYPILVEITNRERISWRGVHIFQMDEWLDWQGRPVPQNHPLSFTGFLQRELFLKIDESLRPARHHVPDPFAPDRISEELTRLGGAAICYGGIGYHGHVAFNEPPLSRWSKVSIDALRNSLTRVVQLGDDSIVVQSIGCAGGDSHAIPPMAVTLGMRDILAASKIRLYCAGGERHRAIFRTAVAGEVAVDYPVTLVQGHPDAEVITDEATARPIQACLH